MRTFFVRGWPDGDAIRAQRFDIMYYGERTWQEWAAMTSDDRNEFIERLNAAREKKTKETNGFVQGIMSVLSQLTGKR